MQSYEYNSACNLYGSFKIARKVENAYCMLFLICLNASNNASGLVPPADACVSWPPPPPCIIGAISLIIKPALNFSLSAKSAEILI